MKYMGSKRYMLDNGLGKLIREQVSRAKRVVDPFSGAGSVVYFVVHNFKIPVLASDLQTYSKVLAEAVVGRIGPLDSVRLSDEWIEKAIKAAMASKLFQRATRLEKNQTGTALVKSARMLCKTRSRIGPIWNAYGGHYYSPAQALSLDFLLKSLPPKEPKRSVCRAAIIIAASKCAAAPGHTAQPFQPTKTARKYLIESWRIDPFATSQKALEFLCQQHAKVKGKAVVSDVFDVISQIEKTDLVIVDPPYSGVQYSRFYHVLETVARGYCGPVSGRGRYPSLDERPQSMFSKTSQSQDALEKLLSELAKRKARVIFTFPKGRCSNGLSGRIVRETSQKYFTIQEELVHGRFSTLGGNNNEDNRKSRKNSRELLLLLQPK